MIFRRVIEKPSPGPMYGVLLFFQPFFINRVYPEQPGGLARS